jgi:hypothetical protein
MTLGLAIFTGGSHTFGFKNTNKMLLDFLKLDIDQDEPLGLAFMPSLTFLQAEQIYVLSLVIFTTVFYYLVNYEIVLRAKSPALAQ